MSDPWQRLGDELQAWRDQTRTATLWWRDDDAQQQTPALERLCELSRCFAIPLSLAVIPNGADSSLFPLFETTPQLLALQHGFSHQNHAAAGLRKCELGVDRPLAGILQQLEQGQQQLQKLLGAHFIPVLVPPWNRLSEELSQQLATKGCVGLSTLGVRQQPQQYGLRVNNVHVDLINWRQGGHFAGEDAVLKSLIRHLRQRRLGEVDSDEATGLMTHHLAHDDGSWQFCQRLFEFMADQPVRWLDARQCFVAS
ncbi:MAG: polysaccharide deacetylase family protein [Halopseudomonas sp.]